MRPIRRLFGTKLLLVILVLSASPAAFGGSDGSAYDKFRKAQYSNNGLLSQQDEMQLGEQVHREILTKYQIVNDPGINAYLQNLGDRLVRSSRRPDIQYRFYAIEDNSVNAFAIPGGYVYVHTGLLNMVQSEDELAGAMAHEIGHVVARHGLRNIKKAQRVAMITGIIGIGTEIATNGSGAGRAAQQAATLLGAGILTRNSRDFEREADYLGLYDMTAAGYDPTAMVRLFQRLDHASGAKESSGGIFASHPNAKERIANTESEIQANLTASTAAQPATTRTRRRHATQSADDFQNMKQALAGYNGSAPTVYGNRAPQQYPTDPQNQPVRNDRPVLTRKP
ncbi:MAG TPA: M48 family metallopeptidase [Blastocatellia bacterium]|nr:M48 family metallopeptidase [Blastocatellia bacterium]